MRATKVRRTKTPKRGQRVKYRSLLEEEAEIVGDTLRLCGLIELGDIFTVATEAKHNEVRKVRRVLVLSSRDFERMCMDLGCRGS